MLSAPETLACGVQSVISRSGTTGSATEPINFATKPMDSATDTIDFGTESIISTTKSAIFGTERIDSTTKCIVSRTETLNFKTKTTISETESINFATEMIVSATKSIVSKTEPIVSGLEHRFRIETIVSVPRRFFAEEFLAWLAERDEPVTAFEAEVAGTWHVEPDPQGGWAVLGEGESLAAG